MNHSSRYPVNGRYWLAALIAVPATWLLHECSHWLCGTLLGYEMALTLNTAYPTAGKYDADRHYLLISAAGPVVTLLQAIVVFLLMRRGKSYRLYPFLFTCFYMRLLAAGMSIISPNDEARISEAMGLGAFTLPLVVTLFLFLLVYRVSRQYAFTARFNALTTLLVMLLSSAIILADQFFKVRLW